MIQQQVRERIVLADALRGFALMGLFIVHMVEYFELYWYKPEPGWVNTLVFSLFGGKAYGLFALLFGLSFFIILDNYAKRGIDFRGRFLWRITLLLVLGYLHSLIYAGDILQLLALCGISLLVCHRLSNFWLGTIAVLFLLQLPQLIIIAVHSYFPNPDYTQPVFWNLMGRNFQMFAESSFTDLLAYNAYNGQIGKWAFFIETGRLWNIFGLMFVGVLLGRNAFFEKLHPINKLLKLVSIFIVAFLFLKFSSGHISSLFENSLAKWCSNELFGYYQNLCLIAVQVLLFVVLFQNLKVRKILSLFAPAGRMTLSFYILQSLIFIPLFYGFGLAWYAKLGQVWSLILGVCFWFIQMYFAIWYTKIFRYGPLEWGWRKLTFVGFNLSK